MRNLSLVKTSNDCIGTMSTLTGVLILIIIIVMAKTASCEAISGYGCGEGQTKQDAIKCALRNAVENAVGIVLVSSTEINNYRLSKDQILTFSNALISDYSIESCSFDSINATYKVCTKITANDSAVRFLKNSTTASGKINAENLKLTTSQKFEYIDDAKLLIENYVRNFSTSYWDIKMKEVGSSDDYKAKTVTLRYYVDFELNNSYYVDIMKFVSIFHQTEFPRYLYASYQKCPNGRIFPKLDDGNIDRCFSAFLSPSRLSDSRDIKKFYVEFRDDHKLARKYWKENVETYSVSKIHVPPYMLPWHCLPIGDVDFQDQSITLVHGYYYSGDKKMNSFVGSVMAGKCEESLVLRPINEVGAIMSLMYAYVTTFKLVLYASDGTIIQEKEIPRSYIHLDYEQYFYNNHNRYDELVEIVVPIDILDKIDRIEIVANSKLE